MQGNKADCAELLYSGLKTSIAGNTWPAIHVSNAAVMLSLQGQLAYTQWLDKSKLEELQMRQLHALLQHVISEVPYYRTRLNGIIGVPGKTVNVNNWKEIPLLTRQDIQRNGDALRARSLPSKDHAPLNKIQTSGSTGMPITAYGTTVTRLFWQSFSLRDHLWHKRDMTRKMVSIRPELGMGRKSMEMEGWGAAVDQLYNTGKTAVFNSTHPIEEQAEWLIGHQPSYILSLPTNLKELARHFSEYGLTLPLLREVRTYGEVSDEEVRKLCKDVWNVPVHDMYSSQEAGYISLQCPEYEKHHVQSENILVEILDDDDNECRPGEMGRVVVTTLHNYAMPLLRYCIGDYAIAGEKCACGRGLPVIERILGRERNMVILPDGHRHYPSFPAEAWAHVAPISQIQMVQKSLDAIEARLVLEREMTEAEKSNFIKIMQERLKYPFNISLSFHDRIERTKGGKYEDFISEVNT